MSPPVGDLQRIVALLTAGHRCGHPQPGRAEEAGVSKSRGVKMHYQDGTNQPDGDWTLFPWAVCSAKPPRERLTRDGKAVTCKTCLRRMDETPEGLRERWERQARKQAHRREAQRIVLARHAEEVEMELAVLVLADLG